MSPKRERTRWVGGRGGRSRWRFLGLAVLAAWLCTAGERPDPFRERSQDRARMVAQIERYGVEDAAVLDAMRTVPRHAFVPAAMRGAAYDDRPLPIGHGQTISQPYIVAEMTRLLRLRPTSRVLEVGTGSGYQAAVLAEITPHVYTIEIIPELARAASERLQRLGYETVRTRTGDGFYGWPEHAPFEAVIVTAAAGRVPPPLIEQLAKGGRMVIPVGAPFSTQQLMVITKDEDGKIRSRSRMPVRFVPFVHEK